MPTCCSGATAPRLDRLQENLAALLQTGLGQYLEITHHLFGLTRPSHYTKRRTTQEQAMDLKERRTYLIVYPFAKTIEWYLMSKEARQGMMNEHIRIGHEYDDVRQVLLYTTGLDDQEFIVAYETDDLAALQRTGDRPARHRGAPLHRCAIRRSSRPFTARWTRRWR